MRWLRTSVSLLCWLALLAALSLPVLLSLEHLQNPPAGLAVLSGALGLVLLLVGMRARLPAPVVWWALVIMLLILVFLRASWFGLVHFSGSGFTQDFFIHLDWQSLVIAWEEHGRLVRRGLALLVIVLLLLVLARRQFGTPPARSSLVLLPLGLVLVVSGRQGMPEYELLQGWLEWRKPITAQVDEVHMARFQRLGLIDGRVPALTRVRAELPERPKNLVLVYLESVGVNLATQPQWPELMPNFARLLEEHALVEYLWTSSYITIEGLTNSMCGTLFPFRRGSDSLAEGEGLADGLPCLGDVLRKAGYHQVYLGGAGMSFAGKGGFLSAHGYDELKGLEYWRSIGLDQRPGTWGLSDADLFEQSIAEMHRLRALDQPWNLTLLTIGTHLPGYRYAECQPYPHSDDRFLDSLHCTDQLLQRWLDRMQQEGLMEDTIVVITADHHVFPNPEMRTLFGDDVLDRRLPLIVIGDDLPEPRHAVGAGYDLAPSVLDLLGIEHNARFILGRSLLRRHARPDYFVKRYADIHAGKVVDSNALGCQEGRAGAGRNLPLDRCGRENLIKLLEALVQSVSVEGSRLACEPETDRIVLPSTIEEPLIVLVGGQDQSNRFTYQSRPVPSNHAGLYRLTLDSDRRVLGRSFKPFDRLDEAAQVADLERALVSHEVLIWRPHPEHPIGIASVEGWAELPTEASIRVRNLETGLDETLLGSEELELDLAAYLCMAGDH